MGMQRWDPFDEMMSLRDAMNRLIEQSVVSPTSSAQEGRSRPGSVQVDLREREDDYVLEASLPGFKPEEIDISVLGNQISIRGEHTEEQERRQERYHIRERRAGRFQRTVTLPSNVQADQARCEFNNGVLTLTLPKAAEAKPRRIPISGGAQQIEGKTTPPK